MKTCLTNVPERLIRKHIVIGLLNNSSNKTYNDEHCIFLLLSGGTEVDTLGAKKQNYPENEVVLFFRI